MRSKLRIITSIIVWLGWYWLFVITSKPEYSTELLDSIPLTRNPFVLIKWMFLDNPLMVLIAGAWVIAASCITYAYLHVYDSLWDKGKGE